MEGKEKEKKEITKGIEEKKAGAAEDGGLTVL